MKQPLKKIILLKHSQTCMSHAILLQIYIPSGFNIGHLSEIGSMPLKKSDSAIQTVGDSLTQHNTYVHILNSKGNYFYIISIYIYIY